MSCQPKHASAVTFLTWKGRPNKTSAAAPGPRPAENTARSSTTFDRRGDLPGHPLTTSPWPD